MGNTQDQLLQDPQPETVFHLKRLTKLAARKELGKVGALDLAVKFVGDEALVNVVVPMLPLCTHMTKLDLTTNNLTDTGVQELAPGLPRCCMLRAFDISGNAISDKGIRALAQFLPRCRALAEFGIGWNLITDDGVPSILSLVIECRHLTHLHCEFNKITKSVQHQFAALCNTHPALRFLFLYSNSNSVDELRQIARQMTEPELQEVSNYLKSLSSSITSKNGLLDTAQQAQETAKQQDLAPTPVLHINTLNDCLVAIAQHRHGYVQSLDLADEGLTDSMMLGKIIPQLSKCEELRCLRLENNRFGDASLAGLAKFLPACRHLVELDISGNDLTDIGVPSLTSLLEQLPELRSLNASLSRISDKMQPALTAAITRHPSLETVRIYRPSGNEIDEFRESANGHDEQESSTQQTSSWTPPIPPRPDVTSLSLNQVASGIASPDRPKDRSTLRKVAPSTDIPLLGMTRADLHYQHASAFRPLSSTSPVSRSVVKRPGPEYVELLSGPIREAEASPLRLMELMGPPMCIAAQESTDSFPVLSAIEELAVPISPSIASRGISLPSTRGSIVDSTVMTRGVSLPASETDSGSLRLFRPSVSLGRRSSRLPSVLRQFSKQSVTETDRSNACHSTEV
eukprot:m.233989 g.233989  ORF g.233989 m.233989 type:complete len:629 (-) comp54301_c0_seq2:85-1971(-)